MPFDTSFPDYILKDYEGKEVGSGVIELEGIKRLNHEIPTHGSISLELGPGQWLNIMTTEDVFLSLTGKPEGWESV